MDLGCWEPLGFRVLGACGIQGVRSMLDFFRTQGVFGFKVFAASGMQGVVSFLDSVPLFRSCFVKNKTKTALQNWYYSKPLAIF